MHEIRLGAHRLAGDIDPVKALEDLFPQHFQLKLGQTVADAAVNPEAKRQVLARTRPVDDELVGPLDRGLIAIAREVPHHHLVAFADELAADLGVLDRSATHVRKRCLPADDFGHKRLDQGRVAAQLLELRRMAVERQQAAGDRIAGGVVAAHDQQQQIAQELGL